jgi:hypothetical protein
LKVKCTERNNTKKISFVSLLEYHNNRVINNRTKLCRNRYSIRFLYYSTERFAACGSETGMSLIVDSEPNDYYATSFGAYGVKVI